MARRFGHNAVVDVGGIVLAGGAGSRMRPLTDDCPKPLLPLGPEPLVGYQLRRLAAAGVRDVVVSTGYLADRFATTLGDGSRWGLRLVYCVETEPLGTGGALRAAIDLLPGVDRVVVLNGDLLSSHDLTAHLQSAGSAGACLHVRPVPDVSAYGKVTCDEDGRVREFVEKSGSGPGLANAGTYVVAAGLLRALPVGRSSWERDLLPALIGSGTEVRAWRGDGYFRDVGSPSSYRMASVDAVTGALPGALSADPDAWVAADASVDPAARLTGGCSVQSGVVVEAAELDEVVLLPRARVGAGAELARCVVAEGVTVPAGTVASDIVLDGELTDQ